MVSLGCDKQDFLDPFSQDFRQPCVFAGSEAGQNIAHRAAQILNGLRAGVNCAQRVDQHDLAVDFGKMVPKERFYDFTFIRFKTAFKFGVEHFGAWFFRALQRAEG